MVALTFDDGPKAEFSLPVLDVLDQYGVKATFFVIGRDAEEEPDVILRMAEQGHEIGNHSYSHPQLERLSQKRIARELRKTNQVIQSIIGVSPTLFRAPGGGQGERVLREVRRQGLQAVAWTINTADYVTDSDEFQVDEPGEEVASRMVSLVSQGLCPGAIILFHNGGEPTVLALPRIIQLLKKRGYRCVTMSALLKERR